MEKNSSSSNSNSCSIITVIVAVVDIVTAAVAVSVPEVILVAVVIMAEVGIKWEMEKRKGDDHKEEKNCKRMKEGSHSLRMRRMEEKIQIMRRMIK